MISSGKKHGDEADSELSHDSNVEVKAEQCDISPSDVDSIDETLDSLDVSESVEHYDDWAQQLLKQHGNGENVELCTLFLVDGFVITGTSLGRHWYIFCFSCVHSSPHANVFVVVIR